MSELTIYADGPRPTVQRRLQEVDEIAAALAEIGIDFRRWPLQAGIATGDPAEKVLEAYAEPIAALRSDYGFESVDVVSLHPEHPARAEARQKFLQEHTHADYEMRFFVAGGGMFYIRQQEQVYMLLCTAGDLISVPAGTTHWFDMSESPNFVALRFFTTADGWVAEFTGDDVAQRYPAMQPLDAA